MNFTQKPKKKENACLYTTFQTLGIAKLFFSKPFALYISGDEASLK